MVSILTNCYVCGQEAQGRSNKCRIMGSGLLLCRSEFTGNVNGWLYRKRDKSDTWGIFAPSSSSSGEYVHLPKVKERDTSEPNYEALRQLKDATRLKKAHRDALIKRGVKTLDIFSSYSGGAIDMDVSKLPGKLIPGLLIPVSNARSVIQGYQIAPDNKSYGKYLWLSKDGKARVRGELPVQVAIGADTDTVILCEGTLKPLVARDIHDYTFIGASGGNFTSSINLIEDAINALKPKRILIAPDAGSKLNRSVYRRVEEACITLNATILDWGQMENKGAGDIDEIMKIHL